MVAGVLLLIALIAAVTPRGFDLAFASVACAALCWYEWTHYVAHIPYVPRTSIGIALKRRHLMHHHLDERLWYGVTNPLGDLLFGTDRAQRTVEERTGTRFLYP